LPSRYVGINMPFLRFILSERHPESGFEAGIFGAAYARRDDWAVSPEDRHELTECLEWFEKHVKVPDRFNSSRSKGYYRRATRGIAWFRDSAAECIARMHRISGVLEKYGHEVNVVYEARLGYVVCEDDFQVVAEPFSETRAGR
jgi:hypothetical protein